LIFSHDLRLGGEFFYRFQLRVSKLSELDQYEKVAATAARNAGKLLMERFRGHLHVTHKGIINIVTDVDLAAEKLIVSHLLEAFPTHYIIAEENHSDAKGGSHVWIIDPLDGTTNYAHGLPFFSVSIGLEIEGEIVFGAIYAPALDEFFVTRRGKGAYCNGSPIHVSGNASLNDSLLATGFPYDIRSGRNTNLDYFNEFAMCAQAIRRVGSAALDLAYLAAGHFDGFWELMLQPWDCAAGMLMIQEAGGKVSNFHGEPVSIYGREFLASNGLIHDDMLMILQRIAALKSSPPRR
jgi:myo-inositol-1(or 4)-monophosphatase